MLLDNLFFLPNVYTTAWVLRCNASYFMISPRFKKLTYTNKPESSEKEHSAHMTALTSI